MDFLTSAPLDDSLAILLAHGAGAPMDSASMNGIADALSAIGLQVARFEFGYMASRRTGEDRKPPPRADRLIPEYEAAMDSLAHSGQLIIGGKSMGGRVASMLADNAYMSGSVVGLLCIGYPFHPPGRPERLRTAHLEKLRCPTLICQGTRDPFGTREEVEGYALSNQVRLFWLEDGDHDLRPRRKTSGYTLADHMHSMADAVNLWATRL